MDMQVLLCLLGAAWLFIGAVIALITQIDETDLTVFNIVLICLLWPMHLLLTCADIIYDWHLARKISKFNKKHRKQAD